MDRAYFEKCYQIWERLCCISPLPKYTMLWYSKHTKNLKKNDFRLGFTKHVQVKFISSHSGGDCSVPASWL